MGTVENQIKPAHALAAAIVLLELGLQEIPKCKSDTRAKICKLAVVPSSKGEVHDTCAVELGASLPPLASWLHGAA